LDGIVAGTEELPDRLWRVGGFDFAAPHGVKFRAGLPPGVHPPAQEFSS
jgi:hypothetical protein